jgi:hypothetical protein
MRRPFAHLSPRSPSKALAGAVFLAGLAATACGSRTEAVRAPSATSVQISEDDPPPGYEPLGPIEATHGQGCGVFGEDGTREGAMNALTALASKRGADFVHVIEVSEPHPTRQCFEHEYKLRGLAYRRASRSASRAVPAPAAACVPPCSAGYACVLDRCEPVCDPPCGADALCRADRTCVRRAP